MPTQTELLRAAAVIDSVRHPKASLAVLPRRMCPRCHGKGIITDDVETGKRMRAMRESKKISAREVARRSGLSAAYICDLELGRRIWNTKVTEIYLRALR